MTTTPATTLLLAVAVLAMLVVACGPSDAPPTSPLADDASPTAGGGTSSPLPTFSPTPTATPTIEATPTATGTPAAPDLDAERERVAGEAIARLAEWTGYPETSIALESIEARDWPSACLDVQVPGFACAQVVTPGYHVRLLVLGSLQFVNASRDGAYAWAPAFFGSPRTIESVDIGTGMITLEALPGSDEAGNEHRVVPGSYLEVPLADLQPGTRVSLGTTYQTPNPTASLVVWLTLAE
jgi:hypothetical protein